MVADLQVRCSCQKHSHDVLYTGGTALCLSATSEQTAAAQRLQLCSPVDDRHLLTPQPPQKSVMFVSLPCALQVCLALHLCFANPEPDPQDLVVAVHKLFDLVFHLAERRLTLKRRPSAIQGRRDRQKGS